MPSLWYGRGMTDPRSITITFENIPEDQSPTSLARCGEYLALEANGPDDNPSPRAWARAGCSVSQILRYAEGGRMDVDLLVALLAGNSDPTHYDSTPHRTRIIGGHVSVEHEWANGPAAAQSPSGISEDIG